MAAPTLPAALDPRLANAGAIATPSARELREDGYDLRAVGLEYGRRDVLDGLDLHIATRERVAILGPNGAGKSSLLRILTGHAPNDVGPCASMACPLESYSRESLARRVAVVPGEVSLPFAASVEDVVALGRIPHEHPFRGLRDADRRRRQWRPSIGSGSASWPAAMLDGCPSASASWSSWPWRLPRRRGC